MDREALVGVVWGVLLLLLLLLFGRGGGGRQGAARVPRLSEVQAGRIAAQLFTGEARVEAARLLRACGFTPAGFTPAPPDEVVEAMIRGIYPPDRVASVQAALGRYGGGETARVRLAILLLACGQLAPLPALVDTALYDRRDVLCEAERVGAVIDFFARMGDAGPLFAGGTRSAEHDLLRHYLLWLMRYRAAA